MKNKIVHLVAAARPNFMKIAPLYHQLAKEEWCEVRLVHTGQHYDANMSDTFFRDLKIPAADFNLGIGSRTHAAQTGGVMIAYEEICLRERPDWTVVAGDVNSTVACALVAAKLCIPIVHLEAGLRSGDRTMPEEINRLVTDVLADVLWTPSADADQNLIGEGISQMKIDQVGNIMIDSYEMLRERIETADSCTRLIPKWESHGVVTLHRPSNVDSYSVLQLLVEQLLEVSRRLPLVFPVHPRTKRKLAEFGLQSRLSDTDRILLTEPLGYIEFMSLVIRCKAVITDSGGVQEETSYLGIPCLTVRENTERPITLSHGSNRLVKPQDIAAAVDVVLSRSWEARPPPGNWDGRTAQRCVAALRHRSLQ